MAKSTVISGGGNTVYPIPLSLGLIIAAVLLSFVDLMFLNDVIGKVLDIGAGESMVIAFALGLVGIGIMAHQGARLAHGESNRWATISHYLLWILLGASFVVIRLFSASILQLDSEAGDKALLSIMGMNVNESDVVIAPLMMLLYLATGVMIKDGFKHLFTNPDFDKWRADRKQAKLDRKNKDNARALNAEEKQAKALEKAEKDREKALLDAAARRDSDKLGRTYGQALKNYNDKLIEIKTHYQQISTNIDYVKTIDKQERQFETSVKPNLMKVVNGSIDGVQNSIALAVRAKSGADIQDLRQVIETHNAKRG